MKRKTSTWYLHPFEREIQDGLFICMIIATILFLLAAIAYYSGWNPGEHLPGCILYEKTGIWCPGCGGTRSIIALLSGNFIESVCFHPLVPYTTIMILSVMGTKAAHRIFRNIHCIELCPLHFIIAVALLVFHVFFRNL